MASLPTHDECNFDDAGNGVWTLLLEAEKEALTKSATSAKHCDPLLAIRILGFLLKDLKENGPRWGLELTPYNRIIDEVNSIEKEKMYDCLVGLGSMYRNHLFRVFRSNTGPMPTLFRHVSQRSFDDLTQGIIDHMAEASQKKPNIRTQALLRDGFQCVVSGVHDSNTWFSVAADKRPAGIMGATQVAHLFSESAQNRGPKEYSASVFAILSMFGLEAQAKALYGGAVNSLTNVITLEGYLHQLFDTYRLWLEPVEGCPHTYDVCCPEANGFQFQSGALPSRIVLSVNPSPKVQKARVSLSLPDPKLIAIRAICARVAHISGAAEHENTILRHLELIMVLANHWSTAPLFTPLPKQSPVL